MEQRQKAVNDILQRDSLAFRPKISKRSVFDGEVCMFVLFVATAGLICYLKRKNGLVKR